MPIYHKLFQFVLQVLFVLYIEFHNGLLLWYNVQQHLYFDYYFIIIIMRISVMRTSIAVISQISIIEITRARCFIQRRRSCSSSCICAVFITVIQLIIIIIIVVVAVVIIIVVVVVVVVVVSYWNFYDCR